MEPAAERLRGAALVCAAAVCWSLGGLFVRLIGDDLDGWTIAFWRSAFMVLAVGGWLLAAHGLAVFAVYRAMGWAGVLSGVLLAGIVRHVHSGDHAHQRRQCRRPAERGAARGGRARPYLPARDGWRRRRSLRSSSPSPASR